MKRKLLTMLAAAVGLVAGAWAQTVYSTSLEDGTEDAANWTISPNSAAEGDTVTVTYAGKKKVKSVKAEKIAKPCFSVSASDTVVFAPGNLQATYDGSSWTWAFAENQYDYVGEAAGNTSINGNGTVSASNVTVDLFGWVGASSIVLTNAPAMYGISSSETKSDYGTSTSDTLKSDWGNVTIGNGGGYTWRSLSSAEWDYVLSTRAASTVGGTENGRYAKATVAGKAGLILFPDSYTHPNGVTAPSGVNTANAGFATNTYDADAWSKMEAAGCVFLPAAGYRDVVEIGGAGSTGDYWSSTPSETSADYACEVYFTDDKITPDHSDVRYAGFSVRLVRTDEE